jgi:hypothetical protein
MTIFNHATGDLNLIINELDISALCAEDSGEEVYKHIQSSFAEYAEKKLPQSIENCLFDKDVSRRRQEGMLQYCIRRDKLFKALAKEGWDIPADAKGYLLLRDAHLPEKARDLIEMWSEGDYEDPKMQKHFKKLERPVAGSSGGQRITGMVGFEAETSQPETHHYAVYDEDEAPLTYMAESLFVLPESFDDEQMDQVWKHWDDPDVLFVAGDVEKADQLNEEEAVAIFANCQLWPGAGVSPQEDAQSRLLLRRRTRLQRQKRRQGQRKGQKERRWAARDSGSPLTFLCSEHCTPHTHVEGAPHRQNQMRAMRTTWTLGAHMHQSP